MKVLIIEDEAAIRTSVARALRAEGYATESATNGQHGLERAFKGDYDLVILDVTLHGLDGLDVLRELQRERAQLPVLILSARSDLATKLRAFELGARDYLLKPFALGELIAHVHAQLWHREQTRRPVIRAGDLVLDPTRRQAQVDSNVVDLSKREFQLLQQLAEHAGEIVTREHLIASIWDEHPPNSNALDASIRRLRKKLGPRVSIHTVRHAGYLLPGTAPMPRHEKSDR